MIKQTLKELKETWDLTTEELEDIREKIQEFGYSSYSLGYQDGIEFRSDEIEKYYKGFAYGKKSDNE
jgi:protoporphyrinogen oxidase